VFGNKKKEMEKKKAPEASGEQPRQQEEKDDAAKPHPRKHKDEGRTSRSGLTVSVARMDTAIRDEYRNRRTDNYACVALAAVIEEFVRMLVRASVKILIGSKKKRILGKTLHVAAKKDPMLAELTKGAIFGGGEDMFEEVSSEEEGEAAEEGATEPVKRAPVKSREKRDAEQNVPGVSSATRQRMTMEKYNENQKKRKQKPFKEGAGGGSVPPQNKRKKT
jgi:hypothetical protein